MNGRHRPRLLIVSDDPALRRMLCSLLTVFDCEAEAAADGGDALARLASSAYDVVCLHLRRAGASAWDAAATIRRLAPATRILLFTDFTDSNGAGDLQRAGHADVALVRTPIVLPELTAALRQALVSTDDPIRRSTTGPPGSS
jgi:two-component system KDP operon response regulator KdpE